MKQRPASESDLNPLPMISLYFDEPPPRPKSKRTRIKEHRAKRHRRRFYVCLADGKERARDTGIRKPFTILPIPNKHIENQS